MTPKELYELAKEAGAEDYDMKVWALDGNTRYPISIDCIEHGEEIITMMTVQGDNK